MTIRQQVEMKKQIIPLIIVLSVSACKNTMSKTDEVTAENSVTTDISNIESPKKLAIYDPVERYSELFWVEQANPISDALLALKKEDTQLWGYNTRMGPKIPGIDDDAVPDILRKHSLKIAPAMGDIVYSDKHLKLRLKFINYAKQYNNEIINSQ